MHTFHYYGATVQSEHSRASFDLFPQHGMPIRVINRPLPFLLDAMRQCGAFHPDLWKLRKSVYFIPERFGMKVKNSNGVETHCYYCPHSERLLLRVSFNG